MAAFVQTEMILFLSPKVFIFVPRKQAMALLIAIKKYLLTFPKCFYDLNKKIFCCDFPLQRFIHGSHHEVVLI